jgi:hypothetical protein
MEPLAEPSTGLVDVTSTPLSDLRGNPTARQVEQTQRMISELLVALPVNQDQMDGLARATYENK